jgi:hypothetical protein
MTRKIMVDGSSLESPDLKCDSDYVNWELEMGCTVQVKKTVNRLI